MSEVCGWLIKGDPERPCLMKPGHKSKSHHDAAYMERNRKRGLERYYSHREATLTQMRQSYRANREQRLAHVRQYRIDHLEERRAYDLQYNGQHREERREYGRQNLQRANLQREIRKAQRVLGVRP